MVVHRRPCQFTRVHACDLSCCANALNPGELAALKLNPPGRAEATPVKSRGVVFAVSA